MVQLNYGDTLRFTCGFSHIGDAWDGGKLHAAIGNQETTFDEVLNAEVSIGAIPVDDTWTSYQSTVDITITTALAAGTYEAYVKLMSIPGGDIFWEGPNDDISIIGEADFQDLTVTYAKV